MSRKRKIQILKTEDQRKAFQKVVQEEAAAQVHTRQEEAAAQVHTRQEKAAAQIHTRQRQESKSSKQKIIVGKHNE